MLWSIFPKEDMYDSAAVLHDAAYGGALLTGIIPEDIRVHLTKQWADNLFKEALIACGVGRIRTWLMYRAVVQYGRPEYHPLAENALYGKPYD